VGVVPVLVQMRDQADQAAALVGLQNLPQPEPLVKAMQDPHLPMVTMAHRHWEAEAEAQAQQAVVALAEPVNIQQYPEQT